MPSNHLDDLAQFLATRSRRRLLVGSAFALLPGGGLRSGSAARKKRKKKKCTSPKVKCGKQCLPPGACCVDADCDECQTCNGGTCRDLTNGAACSNGGVCRAGVCKPDRSLGCAATQNSCGGAGSILCPENNPGNLFCFLDSDGDPVCGTALCTNDTTGAACPGLTGAGSIVLPCAAICGPAVNKTHMCVRPAIQ